MKKILTILLAVIIAFSSITGATVVEAASKNTIKTSISKIEGKAKGFKVTWKKKGKIKGYQIQYSTSSKFKKSSTKTKTISNAKTTSAAISKLSSCGKKYYVRVRTYKVIKGRKVYSACSKVKTVTTLKHKYNKATCTKAKTCKYCGKTSGSALGHSYSKGVCSVCGEADPKEQFKIGEKLYNPLGDNFKLPINGQTNRFVTITKLEVTNKKEADASNLDDYWKSGDYRYFARYIYEVKIVGKVDAKFAGEEIYINLQFESYNEFFAAGGEGKATIKNDGTFEFNYLAHSNKHEKVIIPHSAYISEF